MTLFYVHVACFELKYKKISERKKKKTSWQKIMHKKFIFKNVPCMSFTTPTSNVTRKNIDYALLVFSK